MSRPEDGGLILTRGEGERVFIHDDGDVFLTVKVIGTGKKVALLFSGDAEDVDIDREEIFNRKYGDE